MADTPTPRRLYLQQADLDALMRFRETTDDDESFDIGKDATERLAELGCIQNRGFGRYRVTSFGDWVLANGLEKAPPLPLMTIADFNGGHRERMQALHDAEKGARHA